MDIINDSDYEDYIQQLKNENSVLRAAIKEHRSQKGDDLCWLDDLKLYEVLNDGVVPDRRVGDKAEMLKNCERFINNRCEGGGWPTYVELEEKIKILEKEIDKLKGGQPT